MLRNISTLVFVLCLMGTVSQVSFAQDAPPAPVQVTRTSKRTSGVKIQRSANKEADKAAENKRLEDERVAAEEAEKTRIENERIAAEKAAEEKAEREAEFKAQLEAERIERERQISEAAKAADAEKERLRAEAEAEKQKLIEAAQVQARERQNELDAKEKQIELARAEAERIAKENAELQAKADEARRISEDAEKKRLEAEAALVESNRIAKENADKAAAEEAARIEADRLAAEKAQLEKADVEAARLKMIYSTAQRMRFLNIKESVKYVPETAVSLLNIEKSLEKAARDNRRLVKQVSFCDDDEFVAAPLNLELSADDNFGTFLEDLRGALGINFLPDAELLELPVRANVQNTPWNIVLCQAANTLDIDVRYVADNTIALVRRSKLLTLQDSRRKTAPTRTEFIKLKYLRPRSSVQSNLAGKPSGSSPIESLEQTIQKILSAGGDNRGSISQIPNRAEYFITATDEQLAQIQAVIEKADRPTYRVDVYATVYTINETKLRDIGSQLSAVINTGGRVSGISTLPNGQTTSGQTGTGTAAGQFLNSPFAQPGGLQAGAPNTILGARVSLGLFDFNYQLSLLESLGIAKRFEQPFVSAKDGQTATFENGTQIPVIIQALNNLGGNSGGNLEFLNAGTTLSASPQIIEGEDGLPKLVHLALRLESNNPNLSIQTTGGVPAINGRRIQDDITIAPNQAFIFGGSNDRTDSNTVSRTPILSDIPFLRNFFKRTTKQQTDDKLFFAVRVEIKPDQGESPLETDTLNTDFPKPPPMDAPLVLPKIKP